MSYFDHVRCPSCAAHIDPERVEVLRGVAVCPSCQTALELKSLFGLSDAFEEDDDDNMGIDDLVPGGGGDRPRGWDTTASVAPAPPRQPSKPKQLSGPSSVLAALDDLKKGR